MPAKNDTLHGSAPDDADVALLLIDVINDLEFDGGETLLTQALLMATQIAALKRRAKHPGIPAIYVNDNFGRWQSDFAKLLAHRLEDGVRGQPLAEQLRPKCDDYFVLKPKHSGFYATTLDLLLRYLKVTTVILTGLTGDIYVLFTANDAYMRPADPSPRPVLPAGARETTKAIPAPSRQTPAPRTLFPRTTGRNCRGMAHNRSRV